MRLKVTHMLMGVCVAAASVSCSNELVDDGLRPAGDNDSEGISFVVADNNTRGGYVWDPPGASTRASVTTTDNIKNPNKPFAVYGDMTVESSDDRVVIFNGEAVNYDAAKNIWSYTNPRYWFTDHEFSFVALYPKSFVGLGSDLNYDNNRLAFTYTLPSDYTQATDILIAGHRRIATTSNVEQMVELNFGHIMSRLNFVAKVESSAQNSGIQINSITIKGIAKEGSYNALPATISTGFTETPDFAEAAWTVSPTSPKIGYSKDTSKITLTADKSYTLFPATDPLFVIPQKVTSDLVVEISYSYNGKAQAPIEGYLDSAVIDEWLAGKSYTYSFTIKDNESIVFDSPTVQDWIDYEGGQYIIE
ncbi:MAG: fimbrillin family protein [Muribaculaceae bacterium]|nr:fimbrillin family protein [Muribaculaceae bacterium]